MTGVRRAAGAPLEGWQVFPLQLEDLSSINFTRTGAAAATQLGQADTVDAETGAVDRAREDALYAAAHPAAVDTGSGVGEGVSVRLEHGPVFYRRASAPAPGTPPLAPCRRGYRDVE